MSGPTRLSGDLILENSGATISLSSTSLTAITGAMIQFESLPALDRLDFTSNITTVDNISITDTFLASIDINTTSLRELAITSNRRLTNLSLPVHNVTGSFSIQQNGAKLKVYLPGLAFLKQLNISNVTSFEIPQLETIEEFAEFEYNYFTSLTAPRLETIGGLARFNNNYFSSLTAPIMQDCGDLIIANSVNLTNISLPALQTVGGKLSITNSTKLEVIDGFRGLTTVDADLRVRGLLSKVEFPSLKNVEGNFEVSSTNDISDSCDVLKRLAPVSQCGTEDVHGTFACLSNNEDFDKNYCINSSNSSNAGIRVETGTGVLGLVLALLSALIL